MKVYNIKELEKQNDSRRNIALKAVQKVDPDYYLGKRSFDIPRKKRG